MQNMRWIPAHGVGLRRRQALGLAAAGLAAAVLPGTAKAAHIVRAWPADKAAPQLELTDLDGKPWHLAKLKGQAVALNFWASWCAPCRAEMPSLELMATRYERDGLVVISVNYREAQPAIQRFLDVLPFSLPILLDRDGAATMAWTPRVFPTTVLIDRSGAPRQSVVGELDWGSAAARELVEPLLVRGKAA